MKEVYEQCPVLENDKYLFRLVDKGDAKDYFNSCGLLRLDLRSDYENQDCISSILSIIIPSTYNLFNCNMIATKVALFAKERIYALKHMGFSETKNKLVGHDGTEYGDYWSRLK